MLVCFFFFFLIKKIIRFLKFSFISWRNSQLVTRAIFRTSISWLAISHKAAAKLGAIPISRILCKQNSICLPHHWCHQSHPDVSQLQALQLQLLWGILDKLLNCCCSLAVGKKGRQGSSVFSHPCSLIFLPLLSCLAGIIKQKKPRAKTAISWALLLGNLLLEAPQECEIQREEQRCPNLLYHSKFFLRLPDLVVATGSCWYRVGFSRKSQMGFCPPVKTGDHDTWIQINF